MTISRFSLSSALLAFALATAGAAWAAPERNPATTEAGILQLERSWARLDQELRLLDQLLPPPDAGVGSPGLPLEIGPALIRANRPPSAAIDPTDPALAPPPLALPNAANLAQGRVQSISLLQALAVANIQSPELQEQRLEVARALADLQARLGRYWPQIEALAGLGYDQSGTGYTVPSGNPPLGLACRFVPCRAVYVPPGCRSSLTQGNRSLASAL